MFILLNEKTRRGKGKFEKSLHPFEKREYSIDEALACEVARGPFPLNTEEGKIKKIKNIEMHDDRATGIRCPFTSSIHATPMKDRKLTQKTLF